MKKALLGLGLLILLNGSRKLFSSPKIVPKGESEVGINALLMKYEDDYFFDGVFYFRWGIGHNLYSSGYTYVGYLLHLESISYF